MKHKILSCIPKQLNTEKSKLDWIDNILKTNDIHILVTPQEFFGGVVNMPDNKDFTFDYLFPKLSKLCSNYKTAIVIGVQEKFDNNTNSSVIWFINEYGKFMGRLKKFAVPRYDHVSTNGSGDVTPEDDFNNRFKVFKLYNLYVSAIFCWEVFSDILWTGLGILKPDIVFSLIKFGVNAWPNVKKVNDINTVTDFGYGKWAEEDDGGWIKRLKVANIWQVKCPIICSTNSWNLKPRSLPIAGTISYIDGQAINDYWIPKKEDKLKEIPEKIIISEIDENIVRATLQNKFIYKDVIGQLPPMSLAKFTMFLKINRIEFRLIKKSFDNKKSPNLKPLI